MNTSSQSANKNTTLKETKEQMLTILHNKTKKITKGTLKRRPKPTDLPEPEQAKSIDL